MSVTGTKKRLDSFLARFTFSRLRHVFPVVTILVVGAALRLYNVASHRLIFADEGLISYVALAWMKFGVLPYRDLWAPQSYNPLMYSVYQVNYQLFGVNAFAIRMAVVLPGIVSILFIYLIGKELFGYKAGLVGSLIYAVYIPFSVELEHSYGTAQSFANMLALTGLFFLLKGVNSEKLKSDVLIALSGVFLFLTFSIKPYLSLVLFVALGIIAYSHGFKIRRFLKPSLILIGAILGSFSILLLYLYLNGMLAGWLYFVKVGNLAVSSLPFGDKIFRYGDYLVRTLLIQMFAIPAIIWGFFKRRKEVLYLFFWSFIPTLTVGLGDFTAGSLLAAFSPLVILSSLSVIWLLDQTASKIKLKDVTVVLPVAVLALALLTANAYTNFGYYANYMYSPSPEVAAQLSVGAAIANITSPTDKIFVTDTALAVLSQREVITVGSIKAAGFYNDLMGYSYGEYVGIPGYPEGIINNDMILSALELKKPAVIVISKQDAFGLVDDIIWTGGQEQIYRPLGPYITEHYTLNKTITIDTKQWEIWSAPALNYQALDVFSNKTNFILFGKQPVQCTFKVESLNANYSLAQASSLYNSSYEPTSLLVNYSFPSEHAFVRSTISFNENVNLSSHKSVSIWVKGDNTTNVVWLDLVDSKGHEIGLVAGTLAFSGWRNFVADLDSFAEQGANITSIRQMRISIDNNGENKGAGSVTLANWSLL